MDAGEEAKALTRVAQRLGERFPDVTHEAIVELVGEQHRAFEGRRIRDFVPLLVERETRDRLRRIPAQRQAEA